MFEKIKDFLSEIFIFNFAQRKIQKKYDNWLKLFVILNEYEPFCLFCKNHPNYLECWREKCEKGEHPWVETYLGCRFFKPLNVEQAERNRIFHKSRKKDHVSGTGVNGGSKFVA